MNNLCSKYSIKIPDKISTFYSNKKKIITLIGPYKKKSLKLKTKIFCDKSKNTIIITNIPTIKISNSEKKRFKCIQGTTVAEIKQAIIETSATFYKKLKLIGVGYKVFNLENYQNKLILFKLGYSHPIYFRIPKQIKIFSLKFTKLFISGNSYRNVSQIASTIRSYKKPEPYKGKGILYESEKIILKEGKKI